MTILKHQITRSDLSHCPGDYYDNLVKGVVDVDRHLLAIDAEMQADLEALLLDDGSVLSSLWGINLYKDGADCEDFIEYDSVINLRAYMGNRTRGVDDPAMREKVRKVVAEWIKD